MAEERIQFEAVTLQATDRYDQEVGGIDFSLRAGECLLIEIEEERGCPPFADTAEGLLAPAAGCVRMDGRDWLSISPDEAAAYRSVIGRVFEEQAWVSNLDVDENVTLAQRHHTGRSEKEIRDEALQWAGHFGRASLPAIRPAWAPRHELVMAQWVRALIGAPRLMILERPTRDAGDEECGQLLEAVRERREKGAAVIWLTSDARLVNNESLDPRFRAKVLGGRWEISE